MSTDTVQHPTFDPPYNPIQGRSPSISVGCITNYPDQMAVWNSRWDQGSSWMGVYDSTTDTWVVPQQEWNYGETHVLPHRPGFVLVYWSASDPSETERGHPGAGEGIYTYRIIPGLCESVTEQTTTTAPPESTTTTSVPEPTTTTTQPTTTTTTTQLVPLPEVTAVTVRGISAPSSTGSTGPLVAEATQPSRPVELANSGPAGPDPFTTVLLGTMLVLTGLAAVVPTWLHRRTLKKSLDN